jgi:hypothetical protein
MDIANVASKLGELDEHTLAPMVQQLHAINAEMPGVFSLLGECVQSTIGTVHEGPVSECSTAGFTVQAGIEGALSAVHQLRTALENAKQSITG